MSDPPSGLNPEKTLFISRAGADAAFAAVIGRVLEAAGYRVTLQQWDFANRNFIERIHEALASGARVVGLLSPEYLKTDYCAAEWQNALAGDPLNTKGRLILLRVAECEPVGLLAGIAYWDLVPVRGDQQLLESIVRDAVAEGRRTTAPVAGPYWRAPRAVVDQDAIYPTSSFTGRAGELAALAAAFAAASERVAVIYGLGGMGKSSLAREFAWRNRERYSVVWWFNAETENGVIEGLLRLGAIFVRGLDQLEDRRAAAQQVMTTVLSGFSKPLLLLFDNLEDEMLLRTWRPRTGAHVLATSRTATWDAEIAPISLDTWSTEDAIAYLRHGSGRELQEVDAAAVADALGGLPLALAHAAAYLRATRTVTAKRYLERVAQQMASAPRNAEYPRSVFATFHEAIAEAERQAPGAAPLLCFAAWFAPDAIPDELFHQKVELYPEGGLRDAVSDALCVDEALGALDRLSLVTFSPSTASYSMHRLVQLAARDMVGGAVSTYIDCAIAILAEIFPKEVEFPNWGQCERLVSHVHAALDELPAEAPSRVAATLANGCALYLRYRGAYMSAERLQTRALAIRESALGPNHPDTATSLNNLALLYWDQGRYSDAEPLHVRALAIREKALGPNHADTAKSLSNLAILYDEQGRYAEAEPLQLRALAIREKALAPDHPNTARSLNNLAKLYWDQGRYAEAEPLYVRALTIWENALGPDHPEMARSLNNLAVLYGDQGRYAEAEPLVARALAIDEKALGLDHSETAWSLHNLAVMYREQGRCAEAEPMFLRALAIREKALGPDHPHTAASCTELAILHRTQDRYAEAEPLFARALSIWKAALGPDHPDMAGTLHETARLFIALGRHDEARDLLNRARAIREKAFGPDHPLTESTRREIAQLQAQRR